MKQLLFLQSLNHDHLINVVDNLQLIVLVNLALLRLAAEAYRRSTGIQESVRSS